MKTELRHYPEWLRTAAFYEIYPQSFLDSNADGIGDLQGIIEKLEYIQSVGCDAIWLNPCFDSPFRDGGYDVRDFRKVAPRYGTNADLVRLFEEAHARGMRVVLDLVAGHTSDEHPWFVESSKADPNPYSDSYVWTDSVWHPGPPEARCVIGASTRDGCYQPNFFYFQPALNYGFAEPDPEHRWQLPPDHPACQRVLEELEATMRFWLDLGCDGFRVDMAESLIKGDGPKKQAAMKALWQRIRSWMQRDFPASVLIAEWSFAPEAIDAGFHIDFMIHFRTPAYTSLFRHHGEDPFAFFPRGETYFDRAGKGDIRLWLDTYSAHLAATEGRGFISLPTGNHDIAPRLANGRSDKELKCALAFLFCLPGVPFIHYGDEIGMRSPANLPSKEGGYHRTVVRTPMQWDSHVPNAGFSRAGAAELYLPTDSAADAPTVACQEDDPYSLLNFVRRLLQLRRDHPALGNTGRFRPLFAEPTTCPFIFERSSGGEQIVVVTHPGGEACVAPISVPGLSNATVLLNEGITPAADHIHCGPASFGIFRLGSEEDS